MDMHGVTNSFKVNQTTKSRWLHKAGRLMRREGRLILWYLGNTLGVLGKSFYDTYASGDIHVLSFLHILFSCIVAGVIFPIIYEKYGNMDKRTPIIVQFFLAFQNGFFWETLFSSMRQSMG